MPKLARYLARGNYYAPSLLGGHLSARRWARLLSRETVDRMRNYAEPEGLLRTLSDLGAIDYVARYYPGGVIQFWRDYGGLSEVAEFSGSDVDREICPS